MLLLLLSIFVVAHGVYENCNCPRNRRYRNLKEYAQADGKQVFQVQFGTGKTPFHDKVRGTMVYFNVLVLGTFNDGGPCITRPVQLRQIMGKGCDTKHFAASQPVMRDPFSARGTSVQFIGGRYVKADCPGGEPGQQCDILYLDPCAPVMTEREVGRLSDFKRKCRWEAQEVLAATGVVLDKWKNFADAVNTVKKSLPVPPRDIYDVYFEHLKDGVQSDAQCYFKADRQLLEKEGNICAEAALRGQGARGRGARCFQTRPRKMFISRGLELFRSARSTMSFLLANAIKSRTMARNWPVQMRVSTMWQGISLSAPKLTVGNCMKIADKKLFHQAKKHHAFEIFVIKKAMARRWKRMPSKESFQLRPSDFSAPIGRDRNTPYRLVVANLLAPEIDALLPCKTLREQLKQNLIVSAANADVDVAAGGIIDSLLSPGARDESALDAWRDMGERHQDRRQILSNAFKAGSGGRTWRPTLELYIPSEVPSDRLNAGLGSLLAELIEMQLLDSIAGQVDRGLQNVFVRRKTRPGVPNVKGIDLDMSFGDLRGAFEGGMLLKPPPFVSSSTKERIMALTDERLDDLFSHFPPIVRKALFPAAAKARLAQVKQVLERMGEGNVIRPRDMMRRIAELTEETSIWGMWKKEYQDWRTSLDSCPN
jgi:hypothetical protein